MSVRVRVCVFVRVAFFATQEILHSTAWSKKLGERGKKSPS